MRTRFVILLMGSFVFAGTEVQAQTCRGSVSIAQRAHGLVDVGTAFSKHVNSYGASVGGGSDAWFAGGGIQGLHYSDLDARTWALTGIGGAQIATDPGRYLMVCPMAAVSFERANAIFGEDMSASTLTTNMGVAVGVNAFQSTAVVARPDRRSVPDERTDAVRARDRARHGQRHVHHTPRRRGRADRRALQHHAAVHDPDWPRRGRDGVFAFVRLQLRRRR